MNTPVLGSLDLMLQRLGTDTTQLGNGSIGLIAAPFTPGPTLTISQITEANFHGYARVTLGTTSVTFSGGDGNEYIEFSTARFQCSDTVTPNTIYGLFLTTGSGTVTMWGSDKFGSPLPMAAPNNQITITPRVGLSPTGNFGLNIISN